ncbi:MAG: PTS transporter subunit EIIA [Alphaproteobacteria bacterium]|nr:PTS transporter subunit EIIA [Alphaproteobacteria bacterium]
MKFSDLISSDAVLTGIDETEKKDVIMRLSEVAANVSGVSKRAVYDVLMERERLGTTGVGYGVAIPHGKMPDIDNIYGVLTTSKLPVNFQSADGMPVDIMFLLLTPAGAGADHLKALAKVSSVLRDEDICNKIRSAKDPSELYKVLLDCDEA